MKTKFFILVSCLTLGAMVQAQSRCWGKKKDKNMKLVSAYSQKTVPGIPGAQAKTSYQFIVIWEGRHYPETFFWRGENGWLNCRMLKAHKIATGNTSDGDRYSTDFVIAATLHRRDTLELTPMPGGKFPIPSEIPTSARNTLFYKTGGSGWLAFPVKKITAKPDKLMP